MGFGEAISSVFRKGLDFQGRAIRSEFWFFQLFCFLAGGALQIVDRVMSGVPMGQVGILSGLFYLAVFVPNLAVGFRRLHDIGKSAWWLLIILTGIGAFVILFWNCQRGEANRNAYGDDPLNERA